ncbi:MAG: ABC transporter ATP-binding protein [Candidatus Dormibacteria bacterium]
MPERRRAVEVRDLVKRYRGARRDALHGVSFDVLEGDLHCVVGPNGAGKSTILSILTTTLAPTSGSVRIAGHDAVGEQALVRRELGVVFQHLSLDLNLSAEENIRMHAVLYGLFAWRPAYRLMPVAYRERVSELAELLGLGEDIRRRAGSLSGGMRRRLEIARALVHEPGVLILDEPTAGLDPEVRAVLWDHLGRVRRQRVLTVVFTTHHLDEAEGADSVSMVREGAIVGSGAPAILRPLPVGSPGQPSLESAPTALSDRGAVQGA